MSFLFKSSKKNASANAPGSHALPAATRDIRSSDGPQSQIPTLNGLLSVNGGSKPGSPTPGQQGSVNNSLNSLAGSGNGGGMHGMNGVNGVNGVNGSGNGMGMGIGGERSPSAPPQEERMVPYGMRQDGGGGGARGSGPPSPEQKSLRDRSQEAQMSQRLPPQQARPPPPPTDASPYPWSQRRLTFTVSHTNPFPRYGAAVNATGSKDGAVYLMGGLINGSTVKGDLWMVEAGAPANVGMTCYPVATTSEGPGPRVGHASLLVGNAFIVFGGDTKMDEGDALDDTLYLLNTSTKQWSRALPAGPRPPGRYGHTLNILGSKIYIFGGQVEGYFFNDLVAFDLNALQQATNKWEILIQNTIDGGPPHGQIPPARTNHTMVSYNDRLYLFGGTDGIRWFNDVWSYSPHTNSWTQLECIGYIPSPREGHAAALVGDVMYIFGGRTEEGNDLGDLAAFRITSRRWYTFQNMGPSPSPRSGHSMTTVGKHIVVLAGEPSSAPRDAVELAMAYFLDTGKIRYPPDSASQTPGEQRVLGTRRPSGEKNVNGNGSQGGGINGVPMGAPATMNAAAGRGLMQQPSLLVGQQAQPAELMDRSRMGSGDTPPLTLPNTNTNTNTNSVSNALRTRAESTNSRLPRIAGSTNGPSPGPGPGSPQGPAGQHFAPSPAPSGPPPLTPQQQPQQPRTNGSGNGNGVQATSRQPTRPPDRAFSPVGNEAERAQRFESGHSNANANGAGMGGMGMAAVMAPSRSAQPSPAPPAAAAPAEARMPSSPTFEGPFGGGGGGGHMASSSLQESQPTPLAQTYSHDGKNEAQRELNGGPQQQQQQRFMPETYRPETYRPSQDQSAEGAGVSRNSSRAPSRNRVREVEAETRTQLQQQRSGFEEEVGGAAEPEQMPKVRSLQAAGENEEELPPQDSGIGSSPQVPSQLYEDLGKELEEVKARNAWFASELALARKAGYAPTATTAMHNRSASSTADSPGGLDERGAPAAAAAAEGFADEDRPLIEALLKMRAELARVQETIDGQSRSAAERIAEMERQRDVAVREAVFAKQKLAGQGGLASIGDGAERSGEMGRKLAAALAAQGEFSQRVERLGVEVEGERRARGLAEETAEAAQKRVTELDAWRQQRTLEIEGLRDELQGSQSAHREVAASHADVAAQHQMVLVDKRELGGRLEAALAESQSHGAVLGSLREGLTASTDKAEMLERKLEEERGQRGGLEGQLRQLRAEHEERSGELESTSRRLRDAEEMAEKHAVEAKTHREAVLAGLGKVTDRSVDPTSAADERVTILQQQVEAANTMVRHNQSAADTASEKLRRAEERIAGLEAYQEQASREGLGMRKQLQAAMREHAGVAGEKAELEGKLQSQMLETNALAVQHTSLKDILAERGVNPADVRRSRAMDSPSSLTNRFSTPDLHRVRELEQQLEASLRSHEEMRGQVEEGSQRDGAMRREYEEKLTALDNDHQAAVKYLRGTEKMLSKMKQELQRVKNENGELRKKVEREGARGTPTSAEWEAEREGLRKAVEAAQQELRETVGGLEGRIGALQAQMHSAHSELEQTREVHATHEADFATLQATHERTAGDVETLRRENGMLEERARDAEDKVQLLLDQVESSVDSYRRQSRRVSGAAGATAITNGTGALVGAGAGGFQHGHQRGFSETSNGSTTVGVGNHLGGGGGHHHQQHSRNVSDAGESTYSQDAPASVASGDGRNSMALDSLASELDALRSHWETTNKTYRLSDQAAGFGHGQFEFGGGHLAGGGLGGAAAAAPGEFGAGSLANWRKGLDVGGEEDDEEGEESRPTTSDGTVRGEGESEEEGSRGGSLELGQGEHGLGHGHGLQHGLAVTAHGGLT
ncbi:hypothetical protein LTR36_011014 [Oleoguttula mirabilis]|uniref:Cell polarity protein n=1 Tax=Oleoguttula mirabilis TaxID=1507867 RepID=A0AAV9J3D3_9PEZI|nr:hypothetical protein LTR36_011014 [Oleoguttula mirabilis]